MSTIQSDQMTYVALRENLNTKKWIVISLGIKSCDRRLQFTVRFTMRPNRLRYEINLHRKSKAIQDLPRKARAKEDLPRKARVIEDIPHKARAIEDLTRKARVIEDIPRKARTIDWTLPVKLE